MLVFIQTVVILILIGLLWYFRDQTNAILRSDVSNYFPTEDTKEEVTEDAQPNVVKVPLIMDVSASLVWWDQDFGFEVIQSNSQYFSSISPFWYELKANGTIKPFSGAEDEDVVTFLEKNNIKILPIISNEFEAEPLASIIADIQQRSSHITDILSIAEKYDGVSLNYENLGEDDRENFTIFVEELATVFHKKDLLLGVHVHAKTEKPGTWNGPMAQDWKALGEVCDKVKIMAYDYHWSTSEAGSIAPASWVDDVLSFAVTQIPKEKIYLGIPLYGYDWIEMQAKDFVFEDVSTLLDKYKVKAALDSDSKSKFFDYTDSDDTSHEVWFEDSDTISFKLQIAEKYEIGGVDFWRLGGEDGKVWSTVGKELAGSR